MEDRHRIALKHVSDELKQAVDPCDSITERQRGGSFFYRSRQRNGRVRSHHWYRSLHYSDAAEWYTDAEEGRLVWVASGDYVKAETRKAIKAIKLATGAANLTLVKTAVTGARRRAILLMAIRQRARATGVNKISLLPVEICMIVISFANKMASEL